MDLGCERGDAGADRSGALGDVGEVAVVSGLPLNRRQERRIGGGALLDGAAVDGRDLGHGDAVDEVAVGGAAEIGVIAVGGKFSK